jgi:hypothetical protein
MSRSQPLGFTLPLTKAQQRNITKADLLKKFQLEDWHGVMDCAADLREHDAYVRGLLVGETAK